MPVFKTARPWAAFPPDTVRPDRGTSVSTAPSSAISNSSASSLTSAKSASGRNERGRPASRLGVQITTSVFAKYRRAFSASPICQPSGGSGHGVPSRARSLFGSRTIEETPLSEHSSTSRRMSTVLPDPDPAKIATWRRSISNGRFIVFAVSTEIPRGIASLFASEGRREGGGLGFSVGGAAGAGCGDPKTASNSFVQLAGRFDLNQGASLSPCSFQR